MKTYICTKMVNAEPMTRGEYNIYRGWEIPKDENPFDEGYFVQYMDGYISWSPKAQFEDGYREPPVENKVPFEHIQALKELLVYRYTRVEDTTVTGCWAFLPMADGREFQIGYGESACVDPSNFDYELGKKYALERCEQEATNKLWELEGYLLMVTGLLSK